MRKKLDISNNATTATESSKSKELDEQSKNQENLKSIRKLSICQSSDQCNGAQIFSQVNKGFLEFFETRPKVALWGIRVKKRQNHPPFC